MATELAQITKLEKMLAEAKTIPELKNVVDQADAIAYAARRWKVARSVLMQAVRVYIAAYVKVGEIVGPPPGRGKGGGRPRKVSSGTA